MIDTQAIRNKILDLAIRGKLVPQDPNDEPASVLLERIRAEREKLIAEGKIKKEKTSSRIFRGADNTHYEIVGNNAPVSIEDEIPFEIPEGWAWVRITNLFEVIMGQSPKGDTVSLGSDGIEFHQGKIFFGSKYLSTSPYETNSPSKIAPSNSVLLSVRAPVGKVNITEREICIGRGLCSVIPLAGMTVDYVYYLMLFCENSFVNQATGTTFAAITADIVKKQLIPLPPLDEQRRIVSKIDQTFSALTAIDSLKTQYADNLASLKKSILQEAVMGKLVPQDPNDEPASVLLERIRAEKERLIAKGKIKRDKNESRIFKRGNSYYELQGKSEVCIDDEIPFDVPENWAWSRLGEIFQHNTGKALNAKNQEGNLLEYITTSNLYWNSFDLRTLKRMYFNEQEIKKCTVTKGDLLVCEGGDIGRAAIWPYDYDILIQNHIHRLRAFLPICTKFFFFLFYHYKQKEMIEGIGIGIKGLSSNVLHRLLFPIPPLAEQNRIVSTIENSISKVSSL